MGGATAINGTSTLSLKDTQFYTGTLTGSGGDLFFAGWESDSQDGNGDSIAGHRILMPTPTPVPVLKINESSGTADDLVLDFDRVNRNSTQPLRTFRVVNLGSALLTGELQFAVGSTAFAIQGVPGFSLQPGQFRDVTVTMSTATIGLQVVTLKVISNASVDPTEVTLTGRVSPVADVREPNNSDESQCCTLLQVCALDDSHWPFQ